jgi:hypothetical protein
MMHTININTLQLQKPVSYKLTVVIHLLISIQAVEVSLQCYDKASQPNEL